MRRESMGNRYTSCFPVEANMEDKTSDFQRFQKVRVRNGRLGLAVPSGTYGRVVKIDQTRSRYGYNILVAWKKDLPSATWIPATALELC